MSSTPVQREPAQRATRPSDPLRFSIRGLLGLTAAVAISLALITQWGELGGAIVVAVSGIAGIWMGRRQPESRGIYFPIAAICLLFAVIFLLPPATSQPRTWARRSACSNNLKQIAIALQNYHDMYGSFPPAYIADENGRPMHSWRVLILPFIEEQALYDQYRFDEPWDGPNNRRLADRMPRLYRCPSELHTDPPLPITSYLAIVGPETIWPEGKAGKFGYIQDGTSNTLLVVESHNSGIHWMEPRDLHTGQMAREINPLHGQGICSCHGTKNDRGRGNVAQVVFVDGSVRALPNDLSRDGLEALITIAGGEDAPPDGP